MCYISRILGFCFFRIFSIIIFIIYMLIFVSLFPCYIHYNGTNFFNMVQPCTIIFPEMHVCIMFILFQIIFIYINLNLFYFSLYLLKFQHQYLKLLYSYTRYINIQGDIYIYYVLFIHG